MAESVNGRILVAEDNKVLGDVLRFNLERSGFHVTLARTGDAAAKLLAGESYDLMFTDIEMPGMNGVDLCRYLRFELGNSDLPVAICSARGLEVDEQEMRTKYGVAEIIFKPFSMRELVALASRLLNSSAATDKQPLDASTAE
ncbi:MAG: response regulator [Planctomycetes bacterium]|nr:response regulator [Planctomycetota bacterium]